jgi:hypothetical protein
MLPNPMLPHQIRGDCDKFQAPNMITPLTSAQSMLPLGQPRGSGLTTCRGFTTTPERPTSLFGHHQPSTSGSLPFTADCSNFHSPTSFPTQLPPRLHSRPDFLPDFRFARAARSLQQTGRESLMEGGFTEVHTNFRSNQGSKLVCTEPVDLSQGEGKYPTEPQPQDSSRKGMPSSSSALRMYCLHVHHDPTCFSLISTAHVLPACPPRPHIFQPCLTHALPTSLDPPWVLLWLSASQQWG